MRKDQQKWNQMIQITSALGALKIFAGVFLWLSLSDLKSACPDQVTISSIYPPICIVLGASWLVRGQKLRKFQQTSGGLLPTTYAEAPDGAAPVVIAQAVDGK
jgi:hypothetical protein